MATMRKLKLQVQMTVDGFVAGPEGQLDWMTRNLDEGVIARIVQLTDSCDHPARQKDDRWLHQVLGTRSTREPRIFLRAQDGGHAEGGVQQDAHARRGQECAGGER